MPKYDRDALTAELGAMQDARKMERGGSFGERLARDGETVIYTVTSPNGYHESAESHEHALFLLVDSHRTRVEDTPALHERILTKSGGDIKGARSVAMRLAREVREANPDVSIEQHDALVLARLEQREADQDATAAGASVENPHPDAR